MKKTQKKKIEKKPGYWKAQRAIFISSFKLIGTRRFARSLLFDFLTLVCIFLVIYASFIVSNLIVANVSPAMATIAEYRLAGEPALTSEVEESFPVIARAIWTILFTYVVAFVVGVLLISVCYGTAWNIARKKKSNWKFYKRYFVFNLLWYVAWLVILIILASVFVTQVAAILFIIALILFILSDLIARSIFDEKMKFKKIVARIWRISGSIHWFFFFIVSAIVVLFLINLLLTLFINLNAYVLILVVIILLVLFIGWVRNYVLQIVAYLK